MFWQHVGTYYLNMAISKNKSSKFGNFSAFFLPKNPLYFVLGGGGGGETLNIIFVIYVHQTTIFGVLGFGFIFSLSLLLFNFLICTYLSHPILVDNFFKASNFNTSY